MIIAHWICAVTPVTAQINPLDWTVLGYSLAYTLGILWELPDYTPGYILRAPRVYLTRLYPTRYRVGYSLGDVVYSGIYHISLIINYQYNIW